MKRPILSLALSLMMFAACGGPQTFSPVQPSVTRASVRPAPERLTASGQISIEPGERPTLRFQVTYRPEQFRTQALDCSRLASFQISVDGIGMTPLYADNDSGENNTVAGGSCTITARVSAVPSGRSRIAHVIPYDSAGNPQMDLALSAAFDLTNPAENPKAVYLNFRSTPVGQIIQTLLDLDLPLLASKTDIVDLQTLIDKVIGTTFDPDDPSVVITLIHPLLVNQAAILEDLQNNGANVEELLNLPPEQFTNLLNEYRLTPATVSGTVTGLENGDTVTLRLLDPVTGDQANVSNNFSFTDVPPGTWQLVVDAPPGYQVVNAPSTVTVTAGQTINNLSIEVAPNNTNTPENYHLQSTGATTTTIDISWSEVPEATGYNVYISYNNLVQEIPANNQTTTTLTGLTPSTAYHVEVKPIIAGSPANNVIPAQDFATANNWNSWSTITGTETQHVLSIDSATFPDQVFFGTKAEGASTGGVWKCSGGTCDISLSLSGSPAEKNVYAVAMDPQNANIIYAGTGGQGLFKSDNNGTNWSQLTSLPTTLDIRAILVDPVNPNIVYIGTNGSGVYRSSDRGETWSLFTTNLNHPKVHSLAIYNSPDGGSVIYAGTEGGGVYRQINNPNDSNPTSNWKTINLGIFGSDEAQSGDPFLGSISVKALASHPTDSSLLYGGGTGSALIFWHVGVWKRQETGNPVANWTQIGGNGSNSFPCPNTLICSPATPSTGLSNMQILALAVDPITPTTLYAATENGIFRTTNGNASPPTWTNNFASGQFTGRVNTIGSSPARLYIGTNTGLYRAGTLEP